MINNFRGEYAFLSNFWFTPILFGGKSYRTAEHAFQAAKATNDIDERAIRLETTPQGAKARGRAIKVRDDWDDVKYAIMKQIVFIKFKSNEDLEMRLINTGEQELIEGNNWHDLIWGQCTCSRHNNEGTNWLGKILMQVRDELRFD